MKYTPVFCGKPFNVEWRDFHLFATARRIDVDP